MPSESRTQLEQKPIAAGYANYFEVGHNAFEFLIDFGQIDPCSGVFLIGSRIAVCPTHAKLLFHLLECAVTQYESQYALIPEIKDRNLLAAVLDTSAEFERRALDARRKSRSKKRK